MNNKRKECKEYMEYKECKTIPLAIKTIVLTCFSLMSFSE